LLEKIKDSCRKPFLISRGWGTYSDKGIIYSSVAGTVQTISKLITVLPQKSPYKPEIGDVVIGRVNNVIGIII
jgi:exosome complex component RRP4